MERRISVEVSQRSDSDSDRDKRKPSRPDDVGMGKRAGRLIKNCCHAA